MRIGISICSSYAVKDVREGARRMLERTRASRAVDLDYLFIGDHHVTPIPYYQNTAMFGRMLAEWGNAPAGALYLLPLWHPVLLAEQIGTLAALMPGRFILQCALGGSRQASAALGVDHSKRVPMFEDCLSIMKSLWAGEVVSHERFWNIQQAKISPVPSEVVEVWIGASALPAINRAAKLADVWLATAAINLQQATEQLQQYKQACSQHSVTPSAVAIRRDIFIGATSQQALAVKEEYLGKNYRGFSADALMVGSVNQIVDQMAGFKDAGYTDIIVRNMSSDQSEAIASIERLADVKTQLRD
ncbi:MAG: LLM class flavin-dependent oxidoreductase [Gammaproteobacteria bacterium]|nr:LLM class flavin-dependent oxidoreductase [Gammaproteobacteria bacterium]